LFAVYYKQTADKTKVDLDEHRGADVSAELFVTFHFVTVD